MVSPDERAELLFDTDLPDVLKPAIATATSTSSTSSSATTSLSSGSSETCSNDGRDSPCRHYGSTKCLTGGSCTGVNCSGAPPLWNHGRRLMLAAVMSGICLLTGCLLALMVPYFPTEAMRRGVSQTTISGVFSCFSLAQLLATPLAARAIPLWGVSLVMHSGLATAAVTTLMFGALVRISSTSWFIASCFVVRCVEAVGAAAATTAVFTIVASHFGERVALMTGVLETLTACGLALAPAIGGLLFAAGGYELPFYTLGAAMLLLLGASLHLSQQPGMAGPGAGSHVPITWHQVSVLASSVENWLCCAVAFSMAASWSASDAAVAVYALKTFSMGPADLGLYLLAATGCYAVTSVLWGWFAGRTRHVYLLMSGCLLCSAVGTLLMPPSPLLGLSPSRWLLLFGMVLQESFQAGAYLPCFPRMLQASQNVGLDNSLSTQALVSGAFWTCYSLGDVVGPTLGGLLADLYGYPVMMTCFAMLTFFMCLCTLAMSLANPYLQRRRRKQQQQQQQQKQQQQQQQERRLTSHWRRHAHTQVHTRPHTMPAGFVSSRHLPIA